MHTDVWNLAATGVIALLPWLRTVLPYAGTGLWLAALVRTHGWRRWQAGLGLIVWLSLLLWGFDPRPLWPYTVLIFMSLVRSRRDGAWMAPVAPLATGLVVLARWGPMRRRARARFLWPLYLPVVIVLVLMVSPGSPHPPAAFIGALALALALLGLWFFVRWLRWPAVADLARLSLVSVWFMIQGLVHPNATAWTLEAWALFSVALILPMWVRILGDRGVWQRAVAWTHVLLLVLILGTTGIWVRYGWTRMHCQDPLAYRTSAAWRAVHMFPVTALPEARWSPARQRIWRLNEACWGTLGLRGQLLTTVWEVQRRVECRTTRTWQIELRDAKTGRLYQAETLDTCMWPVTHPVFFTLSHLQPHLARPGGFRQQRLMLCVNVPQQRRKPVLQVRLVEVQRTLPLLFVQNITVQRVDPRRFRFRFRLLNNRRSVVEATFLVGLVRPTPAPPLTWVAVTAVPIQISPGQAIDIDETLESPPWCGVVTWGMAALADNGEQAFLWNGAL